MRLRESVSVPEAAVTDAHKLSAYSRSLKSSRASLPPGIPRESLFLALSSDPGIPGLWPHRPDLCLCFHVAASSCKSSPFSFSLMKTVRMAFWGFRAGSVVKNLPALQEMQKTQVQSLGREIPWRRAWHPTPVFLPEKPHGQRSPAGGSLKGHKSWTQLSEYTCRRAFRTCPDNLGWSHLRILNHIFKSVLYLSKNSSTNRL